MPPMEALQSFSIHGTGHPHCISQCPVRRMIDSALAQLCHVVCRMLADCKQRDTHAALVRATRCMHAVLPTIELCT